MVKNLILEAADKALEFVIVNELKWCRIYFRNGQVITELGADTFPIIIQRFKSILSTDQEFKLVNSIEEEKYACFIMLSEKHTLGYVRPHQNGILLYFRKGVYQKNESNFIGDMLLSNADCVRWNKTLLRYELME